MLFPNLHKIEEGFWSATANSSIAYPTSGNSLCFQIEESSFWFAHRNKVICEIVNQHRPNGTLFDIGGGNGFVASALQRSGIEVALIEPGLEGAQNARKRGVPLVVHSALQDAGFSSESIEGASLFDVLEHIEDDCDFLRTIHKYLMPGTPLFITVPSYSWLWSYEDTYAKHFRRYTLSSLDNVLLRAGFITQFKSYFFSFLVAPIMFSRTIPTLLGLRRSFSPEVCVSEHKRKGGLAQGSIDFLCDLELRRIRQKRIIPFGGSCIVAARKV